jgi:serine/threonine-protein kinase
MGVVLKAFDPALHRPVAIKVLAAEFAARGAARKRFAREAQAAAAVTHDHVVSVYAVDADATPPYLVMAFIPGQSLEERIDRSGPLELKEILRIGMQTASGLAAAHAQGLVHRDIKPANIMLENGIERVRITDFGLARAVGDASVTHSGAVAGTPQFMAPEQARGDAVDQRADLFSLGSTMYAMATGQAPFHGDSGLAVIRQVCDNSPRPICELNPDLPPWLDGIIRKLHAKDPAQRFQSAAEVADLLERCLAHVQKPDSFPLPSPARELARQVPSARSRLRHRAKWWVAGITLAIATLTVGLYLVFGRVMIGNNSPDSDQSPEAGYKRAPRQQAEAYELEDNSPDEMGRLRERLKDFRQSLTAGEEELSGVEAPLELARKRAVSIQRELAEDADPADPVQKQLETLRQQIARLREQIEGPHK